MPVPNLTSSQKRAFRALAHALNPVVRVAGRGLCNSVLKEIDTALTAHELIKVRVMSDDRVLRQNVCAQICVQLNAQWIQTIGKILVLWRKSDSPKPTQTPRPAPKPKLKKRDFQ